MNQANVSKVYPKLKFGIRTLPRRLRNADGPQGRIRKIQKTLTALLKYERIELNEQRGNEVRGYAERLISEAIHNGPANQEMMELADFWILEKQLVHKLFKVLVPRFQDFDHSYTGFYKAPSPYPGRIWRRCVLELKGNVFPSLNYSNPHRKDLLHNQLLDEARRAYRLEKYKEIAEKLTAPPVSTPVSEQ